MFGEIKTGNLAIYEEWAGQFAGGDWPRAAGWLLLGLPLVLWVGAVENAGFADPVPRPVRALFELSHRLALRRAAGFLYYSERSRAWAERRGRHRPR